MRNKCWKWMAAMLIILVYVGRVIYVTRAYTPEVNRVQPGEYIQLEDCRVCLDSVELYTTESFFEQYPACRELSTYDLARPTMQTAYMLVCNLTVQEEKELENESAYWMEYALNLGYEFFFADFDATLLLTEEEAVDANSEEGAKPLRLVYGIQTGYLSEKRKNALGDEELTLQLQTYPKRQYIELGCMNHSGYHD